MGACEGKANKELSEPSQLPPQDDGEILHQDVKLTVNEELSEPSRLPPQDEVDPFILIEDEPGEQGRLSEDEPGEQGQTLQLSDDPCFLGGTKDQRKDYEDSLYEWSDPEGEEINLGRHAENSYPDCERPESTHLLFAKALPTNGSNVVKAAIQDIVLYLQARGLPVFRLHADKGETFNHSVRGWLRDQGIRATWSEPGIPQGNGQAESSVRWVKDKARTLLIGSRLPTRLWPTAVEAATAIQRAKVLNWRSKLVAPYGAVVHVKQKAFDSSGPRRRERAFETKWIRGHYVGLSGILDNGHVVFVPGSDGHKEKFIHTFHVRPRLIDPGLPQQELYIEDPPRPRRRILEKMPVDKIEMKGLQVSNEELTEYARRRSECLLLDWDQDEAVRLVDELAEKGLFAEVKFGVFRHGGSVGWMKGFAEYPELAKVLSQMILKVNPEANFTAIWVARNSERGLHKDFNNDEDAVNYVLPIRLPSRGGELWVELSQGDVVRGEIMERRDDRGNRFFGQVYPLVKGNCNVFSPRQRHEVLPWEGTRTVLIAYTPQGLGKLTTSMIQELEDHGYPPPITQFPEYFLKDPTYNANSVGVCVRDPVDSYVKTKSDTPPKEGMVITDEDVDDWEMFMEVENGFVKIAETQEEKPNWEPPQARKIEMGYTKGIEAILRELKSPLEVVHNVDPREVLENLEAWEPAIRKEVEGVSVAIKRLLLNTDERRLWMQRPTAQRLPTKLVFTVKPGDAPDPTDQSTWYKRKARLVVCGNFAANDNSDLYTETPPTEAIRAGLVLSCQRKWSVALIDIVAAFLRTPLDPEAGDPVVMVAPPKLLQRLGIIEEGETWGLVRALYGLRQAPALWAAHRDRVLQGMTFGSNLHLHRGRTITAWWTLRDDRDLMVALVIIYVDDIVLIGEEETIKMLAKEIQKVWKTSELSILRPGRPVRVLGMELEVDDNNEVIYVNQRGYIEEILRSYRIPEGAKDKIPLGKDLASFEVGEDDLEPDAKAVSDSQRLTGELMWISQKTRPDLSYTCSLMSALTLRAPHRCIEIGRKVLRYLNATKDIKMMIKDKEECLTLFPDAAFAPSSNRSQTGWAIYWRGTPLAWRSGRQGTIALSTAEAELQAILDGAIGMMGLEAMLCDVKIDPAPKTVASDSTSALAIGSGTGSWRTRHLRLKSAWLQQMVASGELCPQHEPGITQPADLLTKPLSGQRIRDLMRLWLMHDGVTPSRPSVTSSSMMATRVLVATVCCILMLGVEARESEPGRSIEVDRGLVEIFMTMLMVLGAVVLWEVVKWLSVEFYHEYSPGASARKLRRLKKLRDATTRAIDQELARLEASEPRRRDAPSTPRTQDLRTTSNTQRRQESAGEALGAMTPTRTSSSPPKDLPWESPGMAGSSGTEENGQFEDERLSRDVLMLLTVEQLKEGLRQEGLAVSGIKADMVRRLSDNLVTKMMTRQGPTQRQLRYVLWLWRHGNVSGRYQLKWEDVNDRVRVSRFIHAWKDR